MMICYQEESTVHCFEDVSRRKSPLFAWYCSFNPTSHQGTNDLTIVLMLHIVKGNKTCHLLSAFIYRKCFRKYKPFEKCRNVFNCLYTTLIHKDFSFMSVVSKRVFTCRILVRTSFTSTRTFLTLPRISERLHEPGELSISSASMKSRLQIRIIKSYNIEIYSFVQNSLWTCAIC